MRLGVILLGTLVSACGGGGGSSAPALPDYPTPPPISTEFAFSEIATSESAFALFNPTSPHVGVNGWGTFIAYQHTSNADYSEVEQRILWDNGASLLELDRRVITGNPYCLVASPVGALFAAWGDHLANEVHVLRWASPQDALQEFVFSSDQAGNAKYSCAWDEARQALWFIGTGFELLKIGAQGELLSKQDLADYVHPFHIEYPAIRLATDGALELGWTTVDLRQPTTNYRTMHYMRSPDGMNWSNTGHAPFLAAPEQEVQADELGPAFNIAPDQADANTHLTALYTEPNGTHHFTWWRHPNTSGRCFAEIEHCTLGYRNSGSAAAVAEFAAGSESPRGALGGVFGNRGEALFYLTAYSGKASVFRSLNHGETWTMVADTQIPDSDGKCIKDFTGVATPNGFRGALTVLATDCDDWVASGSHKTPTRVIGWSIPIK